MHKKLTRGRKILRAILIAIATGLALLLIAFFVLNSNLPSVEQIDAREISQSTKILDRTGTVLLYEINTGKKRTLVKKEDVPQYLKDATVSIEDERFYTEPAFDWQGIVRSVFVNITTGQLSQGASTITQQLARNAFLTPEKTITRKLKELILAIRLGKHYSKDDILWLYLNEVPYGPTTYGVETASQTYFNKPTKDLTLAQSAILAAIPRNPLYYAPDGNHLADLLKRKDVVLKKMLDLQKISEGEYKKAVAEKIVFEPIAHGIKAPHFVMAVQDYLTQKYGEDLVRKGGLRVVTTLDWSLQQMAEKSVLNGANNNTKLYGGKNAALVAQNATSGQILAMVGSRDYFDVENQGNFNVGTQGLRQPGSSLKPFIYLAGFEKGYTPNTVLFDVPTEFAANNPKCPAWPDFSASAPNNKACFHPQNFELTFVGPVSIRSALAESINIPAVKMLYLVGLKDSISLLNNFGAKTLDDPARYGLSLVLGGGAVKLYDMVGAYSVLADDGVKHAQSTILEVKDSKGNVLESWSDSSSRVIDSGYAREITDILSDSEARAPLFQNSMPLTVFPGYDVALKTGTSNDYRDAWAYGYTPNLVVGVWAGNNDNSVMKRSGSSILAAVPIWHDFLSQALKDTNSVPFPRAEIPVPEKPVLRGNYMPENQLHTILYYVDKNNPLGAPPQNPANDPQFNNWEMEVLRWASQNIGKLSSSIQNIQSSPNSGIIYPLTVDLKSPVSGSFFDSNISISASLNSSYNLSEINITFNQVPIYSAKLPPQRTFDYNWTFSPSQTNTQNSLVVEVKDESGQSAKAEAILYKQQ